MNDFERRVQAEIDRLSGPEFPTGRLARRQRDATIRALAEATMEGRSWTGDDGALGTNRDSMVISANNFYAKKHWYAHPLVKEVIESVTAMYLVREAAERERARQEKRAWLENKEFEAAETQFSKASDLLSLPHIVKSTKSGENTNILDPANAAVFNAAVNLNMKASQLARRSLGLPTDVQRSELTGAEGAPISMRNELEDVSDEEVQRRLAALAQGALAAVAGFDGESVEDDEAGAEADDPEGEA